MIATLVAALIGVPGALSAAPSNDDFGSPTVFTGVEGSHTTTNAEATKETGEPNHAGDFGGASVWFSWTAPRSGVLLIDTCDSNFDTLLGVYTCAAVNALSHVDANDDSDGCGPGGETRSSLAIDVVSGTDYRIAVDGFGGATGSVVLWFAMTPINDDFADALEITGDYGSTVGTLRWATHELPEPLHAGSAGAGSVWYRWSPPGDLRASVRACAASNTLVAIYAGAELVSLTQVAAARPSVVRPRTSTSTLFRARRIESLSTATTRWTRSRSSGGRLRCCRETSLRRRPQGRQRRTKSSLPRREPGCTRPHSLTSGTRAPTHRRPRLARRSSTWEPSPRNCGSHPACSGAGSGSRSTPAPHGVSSAWSAPSFVTAGPPVNLEAPEIEGASVVGRRVTATEGAWDLGGGTRVTVTYRWQLCK